MAKTCLHISFAIILTLFVVNLNANPKPKADNGIDIIINRMGPMVGPRMLRLRKPGTSAGHWTMVQQNLGPVPKEVESPVKDYPGYRSVILPTDKPAAKPGTKPAAKPATKHNRSAVLPAATPAAKPVAKPTTKPKKLMKGARWTMLTESEIRRSQNYPGYPDEYPKEWESGEYPVYGYPYDY